VKENFTIACVIQKSPAHFFVSDGKKSLWDNNPCRASLFSPLTASIRVKELLSSYPSITTSCVIQNKNFDYYDGETFVYSLMEAKFYSLQEAEAIVKKLAEK